MLEVGLDDLWVLLSLARGTNSHLIYLLDQTKFSWFVRGIILFRGFGCVSSSSRLCVLFFFFETSFQFFQWCVVQCEAVGSGTLILLSQGSLKRSSRAVNV